MLKIIHMLKVLLYNFQTLEAIEKFIKIIEDFENEMKIKGINNFIVKKVLDDRLDLAKYDKNIQLMDIAKIMEKISDYEGKNKIISKDKEAIKIYNELNEEIEKHLQKLEG